MSEAAALFSLYEALWRGEDPWAAQPIAFAPYDRYAVYTEKQAALSHWRVRLSETALLGAQFTPLAAWAEEPAKIACGALRLRTRDRNGQMQTRDLRLVLAGLRDEAGGWTLVHAAEAMEAALIAMIAAYRAEAESPPYG